MAYSSKWSKGNTSSPKKGKVKDNTVPVIGIMNINTSTKNLNINITDLNGRVYDFISGGMTGQRNFKKKTATNAEEILNIISSRNYEKGLRNIHIRIKGFYYNRNTILRQIGSGPFQILTLQDVTPILHGGCLPKKARRK